MTDRETIERLASGLTIIAKETRDARTARYAAGLLDRCKAEIAPDECPRCEGTGDRYGRAYGPEKSPCPDCDGSGDVSASRPEHGGGS